MSLPLNNLRIAVIGQGVIGRCSCALAIKQEFPFAKIILFADRKFEETCSFGPAGLFRLDYVADREWGKATFERFAYLEKTYSPQETGVKLVSGYIQSDNKELLDTQARAYQDIVYNFHWLTDRELNSLFPNPSKYAIHYTAYASEGRRYVPWLRKQLSLIGGVEYEERKLDSIQQLVDENTYNCIVNCAGLNGGKLAENDDLVYPVRGVALEVRAPWHKHFIYRDVDSFTIPMVDTVILGTKKEANRSDLQITDMDRRDIWERYLALHPSFKGAELVSEWSGLSQLSLIRHHKVSEWDCRIIVIHNYGHGANGFTLSWGCSLSVVQLISQHIQSFGGHITSSPN